MVRIFIALLKIRFGGWLLRKAPGFTRRSMIGGTLGSSMRSFGYSRNMPGSWLFLPDALSHFLEHVHCSWVQRSVLVDAEIDRYRAAILHALTDIITERLRVEL